MIDLRPAAADLAALVQDVPEDALDRPTPVDRPVAALLTHIGGLAVAFTHAARKDLGPQTAAPPPDVVPQDLAPDWRSVYPALLTGLGSAWTDPAAWEGTTQAGGLEMSAPEAGAVALDELVLHAWDLAVATGRAHVPDEASLAVVEQFVAAIPDDPAARQGLFGPRLTPAPDATRFERVLAMAGRDPRWTQAAVAVADRT
ncbi:TIGR03086 family metal-binding protein [Kineococcus sp. SYSU DK003]|uniref:TIGR03086 family metal-binding protein n=1 Tax=Kineococcus sp. SYSU DK003 TaxID=3383124 RepID=UPI003D7DEC6D